MKGYSIYVTPETWDEIKSLPGYIRQQVKQAIDKLSQEPRPSRSKKLDMPEFEEELRRLRIEKWRIVYAVAEDGKWVDILAVRKRPPYDYDDLEELIKEI